MLFIVRKGVGEVEKQLNKKIKYGKSLFI